MKPFPKTKISKKLGKKIAKVDINEIFKASFIPPIENPALNPIKLVVNKTGPGVIWPIIIPSINSLFVNHPCEITKSLIRGMITNPPPKIKNPDFKKKKNRLI